MGSDNEESVYSRTDFEWKSYNRAKIKHIFFNNRKIFRHYLLSVEGSVNKNNCNDKEKFVVES